MENKKRKDKKYYISNFIIAAMIGGVIYAVQYVNDMETNNYKYQRVANILKKCDNETKILIKKAMKNNEISNGEYHDIRAKENRLIRTDKKLEQIKAEINNQITR